MKKVFIALAVIIVLLGGGVYYVFTNLDAIVESAIEREGTRTLGTEVAVGSVSLDLLGGSATIQDFSIANPAGFSDAVMASFSELSVSIDIQNMSADNIHIFSVISRSPHILYESRNGTSNVETISDRLASEEDAATEPAGNQPTLQVDSVLIENIRGTLIDDRLPRAVEVSLGDISLSNLNGTPNELARQIMAPVLRQIATTAARVLVTELLTDPEALQNTVEEGAQQLEDAAREAVGDLFGGGNDDEEDQ